MRFRIGGRAAEHFRQEGRHVACVAHVHVREHGREQRVVFHMLVEACGQAVQRVDAAQPLVEGRSVLFGHEVQFSGGAYIDSSERAASKYPGGRIMPVTTAAA
jgi:hypothetical protein